MTRDEIFQKVKDVLVEAMNIDEEEISPTTTLEGDLGAAGIDFLDIAFRLGHKFGIKIPDREIFPEDTSRKRPVTVDNVVDYIYHRIDGHS